MKKPTGNSASVRRIKSACKDIIRRSDAIKSASDDPEGKPSLFFAGKELRVTIDTCCALLHAVADSSSAADLEACHDDFAKMREHTVAANNSVLRRTHDNPHAINALLNGEATLYTMLLSADPTVRLIAGIAKQNIGIVKDLLLSTFTDIRLQLEGPEAPMKERLDRVLVTLKDPLAALIIAKSVKLLRRYGREDAPITSKREVVRLLRMLYDKDNPQRSSYPKVAHYARYCNDVNDPNFDTLLKVRRSVESWAKKEAHGVDMAWHTLTQALKPSNDTKFFG